MNPEQSSAEKSEVERSASSHEGSEFVEPKKSPAELADRHQLRQLLKAQRDIKTQLASGQITPNRADELTQELSRLTLQLTGKEALFPDFETLTPDEIEKQYNDQAEAMKAVGLIEKLSSGKEGIIGIDGKEYPLPTIEDICDYLSSDPEFSEFLALKEKQGFVRLRISPFASDMSQMIDRLSAKIVEAGGNDSFRSENWKNNLGELKYLIHLDQDGNITGGQTKSEIMSAADAHHFLLNGYAISIVVDGDDLIKKDESDPTKLISKSGRPPLQCGQTATDYLKSFQDPNSPYFQEGSTLPEEWLALFAEALYEKYLKPGKTIEASGSQIIDSDTYSWFVNCVFPFGRLPSGVWSPDARRLDLSVDLPDLSYELIGVRGAVRKP